MSRKVFVCPEGMKGRVDKILSDYFPEVSRSLIQKAIEEGRVIRFNGNTLEPKSKINSGDKLLVDLSRPKVERNKPYDFPLNILFEDDSLLVINKISGMVTHPGDGTGSDTLVHALMNHLEDMCPVGGPDRPGIVHRLDKETSGAIVIAKTEDAFFNLVKQFSERKVTKKYFALIHGNPRTNTGEFNQAIGRHPKVRVKMCVSEKGKPAITKWEVRERFNEGISLVECRILTGRTHQIRVHFSHANHPIWGDSTYGGKTKASGLSCSRVMLHAHEISFSHPCEPKLLTIKAPYPNDFQNALSNFSKVKKTPLN